MSGYRRQWDKPEPDPVPMPEVTQRPAVANELSRSIRQLVAKIGPCWTARITYARGPLIGADGRWAGRIVDSVVVRLRHKLGGAAVGIFLDGRYEQGWTWIVCVDPACTSIAAPDHPAITPTLIGYRDLCRLVSDDDELTARTEDL